MGIGKMMKQVQKMQADVKKMQGELEFKRIAATAGGGMVEAIVDGNRRLIELNIKSEVVDADDVETLQDLLLAAINEALRQAEEFVTAEMQKITGGMQLPPGML